MVVTGAGGGVGSAMVETFARANASVIACDNIGVGLTQPGIAEAWHFDLLDDTAVHQAVEDICVRGAPAAVISNAGWTRAETMEQVTVANLSEELDLNLRASAVFSMAMLPALRSREGGAAFVFISSVNALAHFGNPAYAAAKAGLQAWMRGIAAEEGRYDIRANAIAPGSIRTQAWDHRIERDPGVLERVNRLYPLGRMVRPEEVAQTAAFLASPLASGISGVVVPVDAGLTASNLPFTEQVL